MAIDVGSAVGYLLLDTSKWDSGISKAKQGFKTLWDDTATTSDKLTAVGGSFTSLGTTLTVGLTAPIAGIGAGMVKTAADFEESMSNVKAILGDVSSGVMKEAEEAAESLSLSYQKGATDTETAMNMISAMAQKMGATTKYSAVEAGEAFQYMAMAGWEPADMLLAIEPILNGAAAGNLELARTSDIVTDAMTAFKMPASEAARFVDVVAATSANANTNMDMLGESFKYVAPVAGAMNYTLEDTALLLGLMANNGIKSGSAGEQLRTVLVNLANPTGQAEKAVNALNLSLVDEQGEMYSLREIAEQLRAKLDVTSPAFMELQEKVVELNTQLDNGEITLDEYQAAFEKATEGVDNMTLSQQEALQAAAQLAGKTGLPGLMAIVGASDEDWNKLAGAIDNSNGKAKEMAEIQLDNLKGKLTILKSSIEGASIAFGNIMIPAIEKVTEWFQKLMDKINELDEDQKEQVLKWAAVAAAIGPALVALGKISGVIGNVIKAFSELGGIAGIIGKISGAFQFLGGVGQGILVLIQGAGGIGPALVALATGPVGLVIGAIALLAAAWATDFGGIRDFTAEVFGQIGEIIQSAVNIIKEIIQIALDIIKMIWDNNIMGIRTKIEVAMIAIQTILETAFELIKNVIQNALDIIQDVFHIFESVFKGDWEGAWNAIKDLFADIWKLIGNLLRDALNLLVDTIVNIAAKLYEAALKAFNKVKDGFSDAWNKVKEWFDKAKEDPVKAITDLGKSLFDAGVKAINSLLDGFVQAWNSIVSWVTEKVEWIKGKFASARAAANGMTSSQTMGGGDPYGYHAAGLDYVQREGTVYVHEGEGILTKQENAAYRSGRSRGGDTINIYSPTALSPTKVAAEYKRAKQELALGYI